MLWGIYSHFLHNIKVFVTRMRHTCVIYCCVEVIWTLNNIFALFTRLYYIFITISQKISRNEKQNGIIVNMNVILTPRLLQLGGIHVAFINIIKWMNNICRFPLKSVNESKQCSSTMSYRRMFIQTHNREYARE
jgi:hypothetical protein